MATIKLIVRREKGEIKINSKGETLIFVQYGHMGKSTLFSTGIKVHPEFLKWDNSDLDQREPLKKSLHGYTTKNSNIRKVANDIDSIKDKLINNDEDPTVEAVKASFDAKHASIVEKKKDFFELFEDFIANQGNKTNTTIMGYRSTLNNLKTFQEVEKERITLEKIDLKFYDKLINYFLNKHLLPDKVTIGMAYNAVGKQIKNLKAFLSYLEKRGFKLNCNLRDFKVFNDKTPIIYLTQEELEILYAHDFSDNKRLDKVRDLFVLQSSTGLRISDLLRLGKEHIQGTTIKMRAHKTRKDVIVPLTPKSDAILKKYNYELPALSEQRINDYIKEACNEANINAVIEVAEFRAGKKTYKKYFKYELITTHIAVKTFITHCGEKGISAKTVAEITGKTVKVILDHYYGTNEKVIELEMQKAFGAPETNLKIAK